VRTIVSLALRLSSESRVDVSTLMFVFDCLNWFTGTWIRTRKRDHIGPYMGASISKRK
jgi:hypothetical protein